jgi:rRNA-processing protein FCF1
LIDLNKASLLKAFVRLPYEVCVPDVIFESELLTFSVEEKAALQSGGLQVLELPGEEILSVQNLRRERPALSVNDCFAYSLAQRSPSSILLTGDGNLRKAAQDRGIEVHGILWCMDELHTMQLASAQQLHDALVLLSEDGTVRLPEGDLVKSIKKFSELRAVA